MINHIRRFLKDIPKSKSSSTKVRGYNTATRGVNIKLDKVFNEVNIYHYKLTEKEINNIIDILKSNGYENIELVHGIIIIKK